MMENRLGMNGRVLLGIRCLPIHKMLPNCRKRGELHVDVFKHVTCQLLTDPHSLAWLRVRGTISNHPHFAESFGCPKGSLMNPETKCSVW